MIILLNLIYKLIGHVSPPLSQPSGIPVAANRPTFEADRFYSYHSNWSSYPTSSPSHPTSRFQLFTLPIDHPAQFPTSHYWVSCPYDWIVVISSYCGNCDCVIYRFFFFRIGCCGSSGTVGCLILFISFYVRRAYLCMCFSSCSARLNFGGILRRGLILCVSSCSCGLFLKNLSFSFCIFISPSSISSQLFFRYLCFLFISFCSDIFSTFSAIWPLTSQLHLWSLHTDQFSHHFAWCNAVIFLFLLFQVVVIEVIFLYGEGRFDWERGTLRNKFATIWEMGLGDGKVDEMGVHSEEFFYFIRLTNCQMITLQLNCRG